MRTGADMAAPENSKETGKRLFADNIIIKNKKLLPGHTKKNVSEGVFICAKYESESGKHGGVRQRDHDDFAGREYALSGGADEAGYEF